MYTHTHTHVYVYVCVYIYIYIYIYIYTCIYVSAPAACRASPGPGRQTTPLSESSNFWAMDNKVIYIYIYIYQKEEKGFRIQVLAVTAVTACLFSESSMVRSISVRVLKRCVVSVAVITVCWSYDLYN